jgi:hypothetical protein
MALHVHQISDDTRLYINSTIAFLPSEGFMLVEGYFYFTEKQTDFPINTVIIQSRERNELGNCNLYELKIKKISKKYLPAERKTQMYDEDLGGYISFFEKYIMIIYFDVISFNENKGTNNYLNVNVDTRFNSAKELLERYEKLDDYESDDSEETQDLDNDEFFKGYFKLNKITM